MKIINMLVLLCVSLYPSVLSAQYNEQQKADALIVFNALKQLDGLDTQLVLPKLEQAYKHAESELEKLNIIYKIITINASSQQQQNVYYQELKQLSQRLGLVEYEQIATLHLALHNTYFSNEDSMSALASWRKKMPKTLPNRVYAHYLLHLSRVDKSQSTIQQINQHYQTLELENKLPRERFMLLDSLRRYDQVLEQKRAITKLAFEYALQYQYPMNRLTYLYNQIILLVDNAEYELAKQHADYYLELATNLNDRIELFFANQIKGYVLIFQRKFDEALSYINNADHYTDEVSIRWQMQNKRFAARALLLQGQLEQARKHHFADRKYVQSSPQLDQREIYFHDLNHSYITLLERNTVDGISMIENIFYRAYADVITEHNSNVSKIRELANKELDARVRANTNSNYLIVTLIILALLFITICFSLTRQIRLRKALQKSRDVALEMSRTDGLTKMNNRQYFQECLELEFNRLQRYQSTKATLLILDLDKFKSINDNYGHLAGDKVLKETGKLITKRIRNADICGRLGGEEFAILLPETSEKGAKAFAEDLRKAIAECDVEHEGRLITYRASIGVATFNSKHTSSEQWLDEADKALYQAKNNGRNQIAIYRAVNDY